ncbi:hypothetical protein B0H14DRAFT_3510593 [Mycena olivaceomarginata]|nr:hypothetical protein B0H14DRAFT_3510593 [Mycena olivaceomarginata]
MTASLHALVAPTAANVARMGTWCAYAATTHPSCWSLSNIFVLFWLLHPPEVVNVLLQQNNVFNAKYVHLFFENTNNCNVLCGLLEHAVQHSTPESCHQDHHKRHPITPVVCNPALTVNQPVYSYTRLAPPADPQVGSLKSLPNVSAIAPVLQCSASQASNTSSHPMAVKLTKEVALWVFTRPSGSAPSSSSLLPAGPLDAPPVPSPPVLSALDSAGTALLSVLAAHEGVVKVRQLSVAVKCIMLNTAINYTHSFVPFKVSLTPDNRSTVKDGLYNLRDIINMVSCKQKFQAPKLHMAGISAIITFYKMQIEANTVKHMERAANWAASKKSNKSPETVPDSDEIQSLVNALKSLPDLDGPRHCAVCCIRL